MNCMTFVNNTDIVITIPTWTISKCGGIALQSSPTDEESHVKPMESKDFKTIFHEWTIYIDLFYEIGRISNIIYYTKEYVFLHDVYINIYELKWKIIKEGDIEKLYITLSYKNK